MTTSPPVKSKVILPNRAALFGPAWLLLSMRRARLHPPLCRSGIFAVILNISRAGPDTELNATGDCPDIGGIMMNAIRLVGMLPVGDSRMDSVLRLVEIGIDAQYRTSDVMAISRSAWRSRQPLVDIS